MVDVAVEISAEHFGSASSNAIRTTCRYSEQQNNEKTSCIDCRVFAVNNRTELAVTLQQLFHLFKFYFHRFESTGVERMSLMAQLPPQETVEVLRPRGHKMGHFVDTLPSQSLG